MYVLDWIVIFLVVVKLIANINVFYVKAFLIAIVFISQNVIM